MRMCHERDDGWAGGSMIGESVSGRGLWGIGKIGDRANLREEKSLPLLRAASWSL